jgi:hypothetical protein
MSKVFLREFGFGGRRSPVLLFFPEVDSPFCKGILAGKDVSIGLQITSPYIIVKM